MDKITIVTAFFHIGRNNWKGFQRTDSDYFKYFEDWARLKNDLIVYVGSEEESQKVMGIREKTGLKEKTQCVVIDDIFSVDVELFNSISKVSQYKRIKYCRLLPDNPESWNALYNYVMLMKEWCVKDAVEKGLASGTVAWVDFGFNKSGQIYSEMEEFDFEWRYKFSDKINIFALYNLNDIPPLYEIIRDMSTFIQGGIIIAPDYLWNVLWQLVRENMLILNKIGYMDDDQTILLMSWMDKPELFDVHYCDWHMQLKLFGNDKMTLTKYNTKKLNIIKRMYILFLKIVSEKYTGLKQYIRMQKESVIYNKNKGYR